jgi:hypothetical protein
MNLRLLGTMGMVGALMLLGEGLLRGSHARSAGPLVGTLELLYLGGWMCSLVGMGHSRATGQSRSGRAVLVIQAIGLCLAALFTIWEALSAGRVTGSLLYELVNVAWPFSHLFMIALGIATLRAKVWRGWRRFTPLLCGLALPISLLAGAVGIGGGIAGPFAILTAAAFLLLGYAVATGGS